MLWPTIGNGSDWNKLNFIIITCFIHILDPGILAGALLGADIRDPTGIGAIDFLFFGAHVFLYLERGKGKAYHQEKLTLSLHFWTGTASCGVLTICTFCVYLLSGWEHLLYN